MRLFRPPYLGDAEPTDADEIVPIVEAQKLGYITVGTHVDTLDWQMLPVDQMMKLVEKASQQPQSASCAATSCCCTIPAATAARPSSCCPS